MKMMSRQLAYVLKLLLFLTIFLLRLQIRKYGKVFTLFLVSLSKIGPLLLSLPSSLSTRFYCRSMSTEEAKVAEPAKVVNEEAEAAKKRGNDSFLEKKVRPHRTSYRPPLLHAIVRRCNHTLQHGH